MRRSLGLVGALAVLVAALVGCMPRELLFPALLNRPRPVLRDFPPGFVPPDDTAGLPAGGFGGAGPGLAHVPVIFVHGNTLSAAYWLPARARFEKAGYQPNELWAVSYGAESVRALDGNDAAVPVLDAFVKRVTAYLEQTTGQPVPEVDIVAHSLGVTVVRQWLKQTNSYHRVRAVVGIAGGNHGVWTSYADSRGQNRVVSFELFPGSPWLAQLNRGTETPGATRWLMVFDGTGRYDVLFPPPGQRWPALAGATNLPLNVERNTFYDHIDLAQGPVTLDAVIDFLGGLPPPSPGPAPAVTRVGNRLSPSAGATLHCASVPAVPRATDPPTPAPRTLAPGETLACLAWDPARHRASPLVRARGADRDTADHDASAGPRPPPPRIVPPGGVFENPQDVRLEASVPGGFVTYSTAGVVPDSGAAYYDGTPVYVPGPLVLEAVTVAPDGRRSEPARAVFDISIERVDAARALERQLDPRAPEEYANQRHRGR